MRKQTRTIKMMMEQKDNGKILSKQIIWQKNFCKKNQLPFYGRRVFLDRTTENFNILITIEENLFEIFSFAVMRAVWVKG